MADEHPQEEKRTWTQHTFTCTICRRLCFASQEYIDQYRKDSWVEEGTTDAEIAEGIDYCLSCVAGIIAEGEKVVRTDIWELRNLTPNDVANIQAAMDVAYGDGDNDMIDVAATVEKVEALVSAVRSRGEWPEHVTPETSAQSQAYIDGDPDWRSAGTKEG